MSATPGLRGKCQCCGEPMVARCGNQRVWHWAHKATRACDDWYEPETQWHRDWKDKFPVPWQEFVFHSETEKHVADVQTCHGMTLEFQHSSISAAERAAREAFYPNLVWVVDATRLPRDVSRFMEFKDYFHPTHLYGVLVCNTPVCFPQAWTGSSCLVVFDFDGEAGEAESELWCLFPGRVDRGRMLVAPLPKSELVRMAHEQTFIFETAGIRKAMTDHYRKEEALWFGRR